MWSEWRIKHSWTMPTYYGYSIVGFYSFCWKCVFLRRINKKSGESDTIILSLAYFRWFSDIIFTLRTYCRLIFWKVIKERFIIYFLVIGYRDLMYYIHPSFFATRTQRSIFPGNYPVYFHDTKAFKLWQKGYLTDKCQALLP